MLYTLARIRTEVIVPEPAIALLGPLHICRMAIVRDVILQLFEELGEGLRPLNVIGYHGGRLV